MESMNELFGHFAQNGRIEQIFVRPARLEPVMSKNSVSAIKNQGLEGDRYRNRGKRQVTLIQKEHLEAVSSIMGVTEIDPKLLRRNIVVSKINLLALKGHQFLVGDAILEYSGECHPCSRMEKNLGHGGYNAMRGHGGITARIIKSGEIRVRDTISVIDQKIGDESTQPE